MTDQKNLKITHELHHKLKTLAVKRKMTIFEVVDELLRKGLK